MVEGPGAARNARKATGVVGSTVKHASGGALVDPSSTARLVDKTLLEAFCVGKEVFLLWSNEEDGALRLHFGMNGSLHLCSSGQSNIGPYRKYNTCRQPVPSLQLHFRRPGDVTNEKDQILRCYQTTVSFCTTRVARSKRDRLKHLDCCADFEVFDPDAVVESLQSRPDAIISDVVLDQNKFPGIGNIIKIESLHRARVHPKRLVRDLKDQDLKSVVNECRKYALGWLRSGRAAPKQVYNQTACGTCGKCDTVRMVKLGQDLSRVTFWCDICQPFSPTSSLAPNGCSSGATKRALPGALQSDPSELENKRPKFDISLQKQQQQSMYRGIHACPQHGSQHFCIKRVRHSTKQENRNRLFGTCKVKNCPFFMWVDAHFPHCPACKGRTILRVSKQERSSGRWFFSCASNSSGNGGGPKCQKGSFSWATPHQLGPIQQHLTPLL